MKIIYKVLLLSLLVASCKMSSNETIQPEKKANVLERTKWKASGATASEGDVILDFYTSNDVREYIVLDGIEKQGRQGTYKIKNKTRVEIKLTKLVQDHFSGTIINGKTMELTAVAGSKQTKYYKIAEY